MRRRLMLVIVGTAVLIALVAGAGTWILSAQSTRNGTISQVRATALDFASRNGGRIPLSSKLTLKTERIIGIILRLDHAQLFRIEAGGTVLDTLPASVVPVRTLDAVANAPEIGAPSVVAGSRGSVAWAAEAVEIGRFPRSGPRFVLVVTRDIGSTTLPGDFLIVAGAVIALAVVTSLALSRSITRPLRRAVATTQRIAAGDLDARVGSQPGEIPELSALSGAIDSMAEGLGRLRSAERQFLLSVSHELRTPLTSIRGYSEAILDGTVEDPTQAAGVIGNEARRLERLVGDLLDLAKLDARTFSLHFRTVDVSEVVEEVAEELRPLVDAAGLRLSVYSPEGPVFARVDPDRLDQVLANLVENAAKYARSAIALGTVANGAEARLVVEDDGPGIPGDQLTRVFDRHYSADRHARPGRPRGSGLGLAIASELSAAMGATVGAESPIGGTGGTRMVVRLPTVSPSQNPHNFRKEP